MWYYRFTLAYIIAGVILPLAYGLVPYRETSRHDTHVQGAYPTGNKEEVSPHPATRGADFGTRPTISSSDEGHFNRTLLVAGGSHNGVNCYNTGTAIKRATAIEVVTAFCSEAAGRKLGGNQYPQEFTWPRHCINCSSEECCNIFIQISVRARGDFIFTVPASIESGGDDWYSECGAVFRKIIDNCNTKGENGKQGGTFVNDFSIWIFDPNA